MDHLAHLFVEAGKLKSLPRRGWGLRGVPKPESVADHSYRVALMALFIGEKLDLDTAKMTHMALLHDLAEVRTGDITPHDGVAEKDKIALEEVAIEKMLAEVSSTHLDVWKEYVAQRTEEAKVVRQLDKLEMGLQALEYSRKYPELDLSEFIIEVEKVLERPKLRELFEHAKRFL